MSGRVAARPGRGEPSAAERRATSRLVSLGSGSPGNATLYCTGTFRLLLDAGLACRTLEQRLRTVGVEPETIDAVLLTHEHHDHARGAQRFSKRHGVPVVGSRRALEAMDRSPLHFAEWIPIVAGVPVELDGASVEAFPVPHDAAEPLGFVVEGAGERVGYATDLGAVTGLVAASLAGCDALVIESNHDARMLREGPYPRYLKERVASDRGHLSNDETATLLERVAHPRLRAVVLAHLSENNNRPDLARDRAERALACAPDATLHVAATRETSEPVTWGTTA
ncbi:MAG: MBL fold metallo-hydrolase [Planctomycetota bacterium]|nr:MBL fold metallo-hydrolase [Planctomycetota bacterium]